MEHKMIFRIALGEYDDYEYLFIQHPTKTVEEFHNDLKMVMNESVEGFLNDENIGLIMIGDLVERSLPDLSSLGYTHVDFGQLHFKNAICSLGDKEQLKKFKKDFKFLNNKENEKRILDKAKKLEEDLESELNEGE